MDIICVGREIELKTLRTIIDKAASGNFQICFVIGEAGSGKTTLLNAFVETIEKELPDVIVAIGECDSRTGISDPYLPFKEVLGMLTGETEAKLARGRISPQTSKKLGKFFTTSIETIWEMGPDLIGTVLPGGGLVARALQILSEKSEFVKKIRMKIDNPVAVELSQSTIFQEYTNVLSSLSKIRPLLIILDDLHWADSASVSLLFHLSRKLASSRVMIIGTYRPDEIHTITDGSRHPMESVVNELKRYFGDIEINIDFATRPENQSQAFVNSIIDIEPNNLDQEFRTKLNSLTEGNALFTAELLYNLKEKGDLFLDSTNKWIERPTLNWQTLPAKVEGVIEERIARLEKELRESLSIASVEGENFTAQVISRLQALNERYLLHRLTDELEKRHRLVIENGELKVGSIFLSFYRFSHSLVHQYLYKELALSERRILHKQVAETLELLYQNQAETISAQLARHYEEAGETEKAIFHLTITANKALRLSALREAKENLEKALKLGTAEISILNTLHRQISLAFYGIGDYISAKLHLEKCLELCGIMKDQENLAICQIYLSKTLVEMGEFELAEKHIRNCLDIAKTMSNHEILTEGLSILGYILYMIGEAEQAETVLEESLELEKNLGRNMGLDTYYILGCCAIVMGNLQKAETSFLENIRIAREIGSREIESYCLTDLGFVAYEVGDYKRAKEFLEQGLALGKEIDAQWTIAEAYCGLGFINVQVGDYLKAKEQLQEALKMFYETKTITGIYLVLVGFASLFNKQNQRVNALELLGLCSNYAGIADIDHYMKPILEEMKLETREEVVTSALERGRSLSLDDTISNLINN